MAHGGTDKYYNPANKVVNDGDTAFAKDLNDVNYAVDTALALVADDLDVMDVRVTNLSAEAEAWAHNDQGIPPDTLEPAEFSSKAYATESKEYAIQAEGVVIHKADGTTQLINSAHVSATKAAASQAAALSSKNAAALSETNAEAHSLQAWADQQVGFESMQDAQAAASAAKDSADLAALSAANLPNATTAGANKISVTNSNGNGWEYPPITAAGKALLDDANAAAQRVTLGLGNVDNTSDVNKPISIATNAALIGKADTYSPTFSGAPAAATPYNTDDSTRIATTAFIHNVFPSLASPQGFQFFPGGIMIQWGSAECHATPGNGVIVTYPLPFLGIYSVVATGISGGTANAAVWVSNITGTTFDLRAAIGGQSAAWVAIGYRTVA